MLTNRTAFAAALAALAALLLPAQAPAAPVANPSSGSAWRLPPPPYPAANPYNQAKAELGRQLFFDPRLSGDPSQACATCHNPGLGWADGMRRAMGGNRALGRHTPSLFNLAYLRAFFWDGRAQTLEDAIAQHILAPVTGESSSAVDIERRIGSLAGYRAAFRQAFESPRITFDRIVQALATFVRGIVSRDSPFDRWLGGDATAMSEEAREGFALFTGKAGCVRCHSGPAFTDSHFHNIGLNSVDPGHFEVSGRPEDRNTFRTPGLRNVAATPPYMHNGSLPTLDAVIEFFNRGGDRIGPGNELKPLGLSREEKRDLRAFLDSLTGGETEMPVPILPRGIIRTGARR